MQGIHLSALLTTFKTMPNWQLKNIQFVVARELFPGAKVPENFRSRERKFPLRTFAPASESSRELSLPRAKVLSGNFRSEERKYRGAKSPWTGPTGSHKTTPSTAIGKRHGQDLSLRYTSRFLAL